MRGYFVPNKVRSHQNGKTRKNTQTDVGKRRGESPNCLRRRANKNSAPERATGKSVGEHVRDVRKESSEDARKRDLIQRQRGRGKSPKGGGYVWVQGNGPG